jgi:signal transduction histidine kinase
VGIEVADDGPGIPTTELDRIFEDFYTTRPGGTGLGLSVVRRLVTDLGGHLRVESRVGEGSRFVVELPAAGGARAEGSGA